MRYFLPIIFCLFYSITAVKCQPLQNSPHQTHNPLVLKVNFDKGHQVVRNFGASTGMRAGYLVEHWPKETLQQMARWVFSKKFDGKGTPVGIGLSSFRFEIGAGSAFNDKSGIAKKWRKSECWLLPDGSYDWNNSSGVIYWMREAKKFHVPTLIGYSNSPPIYWTKSGYGYKLEKSMDANLKADRYDDYAGFLATVADHFEKQGVPFDYISPVNEPQWAWTGSPKKAKQEGSPWTNEQIRRIVTATSRAFAEKGVSTKILITEAGAIDYLYKSKPNSFAAESSNQIQAFWDSSSSQYIGNLSHLASYIGGHSYWTDTSDSLLVAKRKNFISP